MPASQAGRRRFESGRPLQLWWGAPKWPPTPPNARRAPNESGRASIPRVVKGPRNGPHINRPLRCGGDEVLFLVAGGAGEAAVHDLVEQGLVADLQQARGLGPIPVDALE